MNNDMTLTIEQIQKLYWAYIRSLCPHDRIVKALTKEYGSVLVLKALSNIKRS